MDRMHGICLQKNNGHLKCCSSNYTCKTALATLISLNLKPLKPAIAIQLPKIMVVLSFLHFRRYQSYLYKNSTKTSRINQPPKRHNPKNPPRGSHPLPAGWPPNLKLLPLVLPFALRFLDGGLLMAGSFFSQKKNGKVPGFLQGQPVFLWLEINWMMNQPNLYIKKNGWMFHQTSI